MKMVANNIGVDKKLLYTNNFKFETPFFFLKFSETSKFTKLKVFLNKTAMYPL